MAVPGDRDALLHLRVGVSSCLLGANVRYDGGHKRDAFVVEQLGRLVEWVPICPESEVGMGIPRESVRLVHLGGRQLRMVGNETATDWTERMLRFSGGRLEGLEEIVGYVLKSRSPSCGLGSVEVFDDPTVSEPVRADGTGLFASALRARFPELPVVEADELHEPGAVARFVARLTGYARRRGYL